MNHATTTITLLATLTAGVVIGISFVAQPVKFNAADVALAQQVRIGSVIFHASHQVQLVMLVLLAGAMLVARVPSTWLWSCAAAAVIALAVQALVLMPRFDARVAALSAGQALASQPGLHGSYIALEVIKVLALAAVAWSAASGAHPRS